MMQQQVAPQLSTRPLVLWLVWLSFIGYLLAVAPPLPADAFQPLQTLLSGQIPHINPVSIALFSFIGIWILIYSCLLFVDGRTQSLPVWAFVLASLGTGILAIVPYLALRQPNHRVHGSQNFWLALLESRSTGIILTFSAFLLLGFALLFGDWFAFWQEFQTNRFMHGMSLAFCGFTLLFPYPTLLQDDMVRRGLHSDSSLFWFTALVPLFGPLTYLCLRPPLQVKH